MDEEIKIQLLLSVKGNLGANYGEENYEILSDILDDVTSIACNCSNRKSNDVKLFPYIKKAVKAEYLARGAEGLLSRSEGSISSTYEDILDKMRNNIIKNRIKEDEIMLLRNLKKVYVSRATEEKIYGEYSKKWSYIDTVYLNMQQDINELDRKTSGEIDYSIYKARTTRKYDIKKGDGISLNDISKSNDFKPEYRIMDINQIGDTYMYRLEKYNV